MEKEMLSTIPQESCVVTEHPFREYDHLRVALRDEIISGRETFVRIGYLLKVARDTDILNGSGYGTYLEFAEGEFNLDASSVSRFIGINDRFSVGHNSAELAPEYKNFGRAKLQEMLTLPDYLTETFQPEMSKSEIKAIKEEYTQEQAITPLEVMVEPDQRPDEPNIDRFIYELLKKNKDLFKELFTDYNIRIDSGFEDNFVLDVIDRLLPCDDFKIWIARPAGLGKCQLKLTEETDIALLTSLRGDFSEEVDYKTLTEAVVKQIPKEITSTRAAYETRFGEMWEDPDKEEEIAPVQPKVAKSRVSVAKEKPRKVESVQNKPESDKKPQKVSDDEQKMSEPEVLTSAPVAPDHQPDPLPEEKPEVKQEESITPPKAEDYEKLSRGLNIWDTDISSFLKDIRNYDSHSLFTELTLNAQELEKNARNMSREGKTVSFTAAVNEARRIVCLLDEIQWRWNEKTELQKEINR